MSTKLKKGVKQVVEREETLIKQQHKQTQSFFEGLLNNFWRKYSKQTAPRLKLIDTFLTYLFVVIIFQVFYRVIAGTDFPKNAFLSGIFAPIGVMVMTVALRMQIGHEEDKPNKIPYYRAFWEYLFGVVVFFVVIVNFLG